MPILSRVQRNDVHELAKAAGLDPADFAWANNTSQFTGNYETLTHLPTHSHCNFSNAHEGKIHLTWWPKYRDGETSFFASGWAAAIATVRYWLAEVKKNDDATDLWAEALKERRVTDAAGDVEAENAPFSKAELDLIKPKLDEVEAFIASRQPLDAEQEKVLHGRFRYLLAAAKRGIGRIDWLNIFVSQLVQLFTDGVLHSSLYGEVMRHAATALATLIKAGTKLLGP